MGRFSVRRIRNVPVRLGEGGKNWLRECVVGYLGLVFLLPCWVTANATFL